MILNHFNTYILFYIYHVNAGYTTCHTVAYAIVLDDQNDTK